VVEVVSIAAVELFNSDEVVVELVVVVVVAICTPPVDFEAFPPFGGL
jgi:hypothetical protein